MGSSFNLRRWRGPILGGAFALAMMAGLAPFSGQDKAPDLGGNDRYLAHISTDKPIYRPGETLYLRSVLLHAFKHMPLKGASYAHVKIANSRGSAVMESDFRIDDSAGGASWAIPKNLAGGEYTATVSFPGHGYAPATRKFDIRAFRAPRIKSQLEFVRKAYGPGDTVSAVLNATRAEGGAPKGAKVTAVARIDGAEVWRGETKVDGDGNCSVSFELPQKIETGVGSLSLVIEDGGVVETASKTLPILLQQIPISFSPEGGELVAGLECGLYFEALTPWGDPADVSGEIRDAKGNRVADFTTTHEGRGSLKFKPAADTEYFAHITSPKGITVAAPLPKVLKEGASLRAARQVYGAGDALDFNVSASKDGACKLVLSQRESEMAARTIELKAGESQLVSLTPATDIDGVLRATLFDADGKPLAERLVFRRPQRELNIEIVASPEHAVPGDKVELTIRTTTSKGEPVSATVGLTVTDDAVLQMIEKRKQAPRLPVMALLENEVDHIEDAHVYLSADPKAAAGIDLLLGTQGWRRFSYLNAEEFMKKHGDKAKRALAFREEVRVFTGVPRGGVGGGAGRPRPAAGPEVEDARDEANEDGAIEAQGEAPPEPNKAAPADEPAEEKVAGKVHRDAEEAEIADDKIAGRERRRQAMVAVREYSHRLREGRQAGDRKDFTETLYWNAGVKTNERGEAKVSFFLSDSVTSFRVMADGFNEAGALGQADALVTSRKPFYLEPKLPLEVTAGDVVMLPVSLVNSTSGGMKVVLQASGGEAISLPENFNGELELKSDSRGRLLLPVRVGRANGMLTLTLDGKAGAFSDRVTREFAVKPLGFPMSFTAGGMMDKPQAITVTIPEDVHRSSITTSAKVYATPVANLMAAMERLITEPYG
jgi:hypothetical protein